MRVYGEEPYLGWLRVGVYGVMLIGLLVGAWLAGRAVLDHLSLKWLNFDRSLDRGFESVKEGMTSAELMERMGPPDDISSKFRLGQRKGFEEQYARAEKSESIIFLTWYNGFGYVYCVGLDAKNAVVVKGAGGD